MIVRHQLHQYQQSLNSDSQAPITPISTKQESLNSDSQAPLTPISTKQESLNSDSQAPITPISTNLFDVSGTNYTNINKTRKFKQ